MRLATLLIAQTFLILGLTYGQAGLPAAKAVVQQYQDDEQFSGVVLLAESGRVVFQQAIGWADRAQGLALDIRTRFRIASITKSFTALLIMQLYETGQLSLDQSVAELLPELDLNGYKRITVHHLLNHTSGLPNEPDVIYAEKLSPKEIVDRLIAGKKAGQRAGKSFNYNNMDYLLLGLIIEKLSNKPWESVVQEHILDPLEMTHTGFLEKEKLPEGLAKGYLCKSGKCVEEPAYFIENFYAAGNMYSTAEDLLKWDQGLYGEQLLSPEARALMYRSDPSLGYVAYGSWTFDHPFVEGNPFTVERRGGILGFNCVIMRFPTAKKTLIILSNTDQFDSDTFGNAESIKEQLVQVLFEKE